MTGKPSSSLDYRTAGVDIDAGESLVQRLKPLVASTNREGCIDTIGGFGGLFELPIARYQEPVLVSGTDGVGTKLKLAFEIGCHDTIGIDLVAMCANDVLVCGAEPLYFLDYFATGRLSQDQAESVISGIARGCRLARLALIGGETAEMPGMYRNGEYDLAGFCVGIVDKSRIIDGRKIRDGDRILGLASSGIHSNGYSLVHAARECCKASLKQPFENTTLGDALLTPTRIYVNSIRGLLEEVDVCAMAHITGGGLAGNVKRVIPPGLEAVMNQNRWPQPGIFEWIRENGQIEPAEMLRTFNCGIGMIVVVHPTDESRARTLLEAGGETVFDIGEIQPGTRGAVVER
ncbi:MAG: phosphoribosylformylglycinamidine cyclo-ligase [Pseudomonadota bacterium]|nr:phosphoribosylformylglycinamidine cyclo-ligase [Pseudomonadota bacterium]